MDNSTNHNDHGALQELLLFAVALALVVFMVLYWQ
jgi:hypothetical protein